MKKLITIAVLIMMSVFLTSFIKSDRNTLNSMENCIMLPEIVVSYDTTKCKCEITIKHRPEMKRRMEYGQRGRINPMMGRGQMNRGRMMMHSHTARFERGQMMSQRGRMINPKMIQMDSTRQKQMFENRQMFKGDTTKFQRPMRMNHR